MGQKKKWKTATINLGEISHPARILADRFIELHGKNKFSKFVRDLIIARLSSDSVYNNFKLKHLILKKRELIKGHLDQLKKISKLNEEIKALGYDPECVGVEEVDTFGVEAVINKMMGKPT